MLDLMALLVQEGLCGAVEPQEGMIMLVLSRKPGERILIGDEIAVTVVRIGPNTVRIGIDAPRDMNIVRDELCHPTEIELPLEKSERASAQ